MLPYIAYMDPMGYSKERPSKIVHIMETNPSGKLHETTPDVASPRFPRHNHQRNEFFPLPNLLQALGFEHRSYF